ncbi:hypothetical protein O1611_g1670 [Lasiodiplodia mahajangana]|uniref:Uncharacterized protein n=1 Tax=Lasiodiplodia mahajangana TaxID=1108764 RepID=A0ACC2JXD6_9PEZI|nr:hypothetical protein O1611_g1670 [Lasiodiplodia mahajangana]
MHRWINREASRNHLREILSLGRVTDDWREEDVTRVKFRLSVVLGLQNQPAGAIEMFDEVKAQLDILRASPGTGKLGDPKDMALLDANVSAVHGRTAGIWSNGTMW